MKKTSNDKKKRFDREILKYISNQTVTTAKQFIHNREYRFSFERIQLPLLRIHSFILSFFSFTHVYPLTSEYT